MSDVRAGLQVVYEDEHMACIVKPQGMPTAQVKVNQQKTLACAHCFRLTVQQTLILRVHHLSGHLTAESIHSVTQLSSLTKFCTSHSKVTLGIADLKGRLAPSFVEESCREHTVHLERLLLAELFLTSWR